MAQRLHYLFYTKQNIFPFHLFSYDLLLFKKYLNKGCKTRKEKGKRRENYFIKEFPRSVSLINLLFPFSSKETYFNPVN